MFINKFKFLWSTVCQNRLVWLGSRSYKRFPIRLSPLLTCIFSHFVAAGNRRTQLPLLSEIASGISGAQLNTAKSCVADPNPHEAELIWLSWIRSQKCDKVPLKWKRLSDIIVFYRLADPHSFHYYIYEFVSIFLLGSNADSDPNSFIKKMSKKFLFKGLRFWRSKGENCSFSSLTLFFQPIFLQI
jgi:hypothetical protein